MLWQVRPQSSFTLSSFGHNPELDAVCSDYAALAGGATVFWIEDLNGGLIASSGGSRRGRTARSALMRRQQVRYAACALGPSANAMVPFFARACQRELDHQQTVADVADAGDAPAVGVDALPLDVANISGIAHDLNNLLGTITGNAELLEATVASSPKGREQAARILRACRLGRLFVARLRNSEIGAERRPVDLTAAATEVVDLANARADVRVSITHHSDPALCVVMGDALAVEQLLLNLIVNSLEAMPNGGHLVLELGYRPTAGAGAGEVVLSVRDDGCGMDDATLERALTFERSEGARRGLGLPLVASIVASHGGSIEIDSEYGDGTQVTVVLPATPGVGVHAEIKNSGGEGLHG